MLQVAIADTMGQPSAFIYNAKPGSLLQLPIAIIVFDHLIVYTKKRVEVLIT